MTPHDPREGDCPGTFEHSFPGTRDSVRQARAWLRAMLEKFGIYGEAAENAVLVLSELATNASIHSRSSGPHGTYLVRLRRGVSQLRLEVVDAGGTNEPRAQRSRQPGSRQPGNRPPGSPQLGNGDPSSWADSMAQESGHGLALVEAFTTRWWTRGDETGRTVGADLALTRPT